MIRGFVFLVGLGLVMLGVAWVASLPGDVTIVSQGWRLDTSVGVLSAFVALIAIAAALIYRLWRAFVTAPRRFIRWRRDRRRRIGYEALSAGLVAVAAGDPSGATRQARRADRLLGAPPLTLLLTAQAAQLAGDEDTAQRHFRAMLERPETEFLGLRGLLARAIRDGDLAQALELAKRARALRPKTPWVLTTLLDLQTRGQDWEGAADTLARAVAVKALPATAARHHEATVYLELSQRAAKDGRQADVLRYAKRAHRADPDHQAASVWLAEAFAAEGRRRRAVKLVEQEWARRPHPGLLAPYRRARAAMAPLIWIKDVERLFALAPAHVESQRALGEAALEAGLWGEARKHFTAAIAASGEALPASLCRKMAQAEEGDAGDSSAARRWLTLAAEGHPDPGWICDACGTSHQAWAPCCARCGAFDRLSWRAPDRVAAALVAPPPVAVAAVPPPPVP